MRAGVCRLLRIDLEVRMKQLEKSLQSLAQAVMRLRAIANADDLKADLVTAICDCAFIGDDELPRSDTEFAAQEQRAISTQSHSRRPARAIAAARL